MNKVAFITGASSGIGEATVQSLLKAGYRVYAGARRLDRMMPLVSAGAVLVPLDVTSDESMASSVERVIAEAGRIDVLVNNAGYGSYGALEDVPMAEARRQVEVNLFGLARLTQLVLPAMRAQGSGTIVNVSSIGGKIYEPLGSWYHATKFAVEGLSDCLRMELAPFGIKVVVIEPGAIRTEWGGIAKDSLLAMSGGTAYGKQAQAQARMLAGSDRFAAEPSVVADAILKAVTAKQPKTRYAVGGGAAVILGFRRLSSDRMMDWFMRTMAKNAK